MANKQFLIELAIKDDKLKSQLKKSLEDPSVQKQLGVLGEGIAESLEDNVGRAADILGKVDWASLLGEKDFERLQQLAKNVVSANKDMIKSFIKTGDVEKIQDVVNFVAELNKELKAINPDQTVKGFARSMASFINTIGNAPEKIKELIDIPDLISASLDNMSNSTSIDKVNKQILEVSASAQNMIKALNKKASLNALEKAVKDTYGESKKLQDLMFDSDMMDAYLAKFTTAKEISEEITRLMNEHSKKAAPDIVDRLQFKQQLEGLQGKLTPILPTIDDSAVKKGTQTISKDVDATIEKITNTFEKSFNKTIEDKLSSIRVKVDVPTEDKLLADINAVIDEVNKKGASTLKLVGAESAINTAQKQILENTKKWHENMKKYLKFDKKEDITLDLGAKIREMGSNVGDDFKHSIEEYFDNPENKVSIPVELVISDGNKATLNGSNVTINGSVGGSGEITAESLAKALTTPIEIKVQEKNEEKQKFDGKLISIDRDGQYAQEVVDVFEEIFKAVERGGENAKKIADFFELKNINLKEIGKLSGTQRDNAIISAFESLLEKGDMSLVDQVKGLTKGSTKNRATTAFRDLVLDSVFRYDLKQISSKEDVKRINVRNLVEEDYIPRSISQESIYKIRNTNAKNYQIPTVEELDKLIDDLPQVWGQLGKNFVPALEALKQLRSSITDPTNETEIKRFKDAAEEFALNTNPMYREMSDFMHGYKIGVFNKGHNKNNPYYDYSVAGGVYSGNKLLSNLDKVDYFELYDDPSGHFSRGNRKDAMDNASSLDRYQLRRDARKAPYRSTEPEKIKTQVEDIEVQEFKPKIRPNKEIDEINNYKAAAQNRAQAIDEAKKAIVEEAKKAEELRQQQLETDKKRRTVLKSQRTKNENKIKKSESSEVDELKEKNAQLDKEISDLDERINKNLVEPEKPPTVLQQLNNMPSADEVQSMIDDVNAIDIKINEAQKQANETDVEYNFRNRQISALTDERNQKQVSIDEIITQKTELLKQRRFDLLKRISKSTEKGEDTASLEKLLSEVESELIKYSDELPYLLINEFEADLLNAKNATEEEWNNLRTNITKRQNEYEISKYTELKGQQNSLLSDIKEKTKKGESTSDLERQLKAVNKEILKYEVSVSRMEDIKKSAFPDDASRQALNIYNSEMTKLVELLQEKALLEAKSEDATDINVDINKQKRKAYDKTRRQIEEDKRLAAEYDPKVQASKFIDETDKDLYILKQRELEYRRKLDIKNSQLSTIQGDKYYNSQIYKNRIEALKDKDIDDYVRSDEYKKARDNGLQQADEEFGAYLSEQLGEDVAQRIVYELSKNKDRADIDSIIEGAGNTPRLVGNAFSEAVQEARQTYMNSDKYKGKLKEAKNKREEQISKDLADDIKIRNAKVQESWNRTKQDIKILRNADMANSKELRDAVFAEAEKAGMADSSEYRRSIVDNVRENLIQQRIDEGRKEQKAANEEYYKKARELRSKLSPEMYQRLNEEADEASYNIVMSKIQELIGENKDLLGGLDEKRKELIKKYIGDIIEQRRESLKMEQTGLYQPLDSDKPINIREQLEKELTAAVGYYEQQYREASGKRTALEYQRSKAESFGELGTTEIDNPEVARIRAEAEAKLSAEKQKQVVLTEKLTELTAQNADTQIVNSVAATLDATDKEINRLEMIVENASSALNLRQEAKDAAEAERKFTPEKLRLWYIDQIELQKGFLENGTDKQKEKAPAIIATMEQKLADVEKRIEESRPESEKPKTVLDMITYAIKDGLASVTSGGMVNLDASLYNIATETTLQEILRLLGGNGAVEYANQLKSQLEKYRPRYEKQGSEGESSGGGKSYNKKNSWKQAQLDKLNPEGQHIYGELDAEARIYTNSLKKGGKRKYYDKNFDFVSEIKKQAEVVRSKTKGELKYIKEQAKLTALYQDYYKKTFGGGKPKKNQPKQSDWATKDKNLSKIDGLKDLLLFKGDRSDALVAMGYGTEGVVTVEPEIVEDKPKKTNKKKTNKKKNTQTSVEETNVTDSNQLQQTITDVIKAVKTNDTQLDNSTLINQVLGTVMHTIGLDPNDEDVVKIINNAISGAGLGRDVDDNILDSKDQTAQVLYNAIIDAYKMVASGDKIYAETSYSLDDLGNVLDVQKGTMLGVADPTIGSVMGHTHASDRLFGENDFKSAAKNSGLFDVLELITPLNKYNINGLQNINPDELKSKFIKLAEFAKKIENLPESIYNIALKSKMSEQGLTLESTPMGIAPSNNFQTIRNASLLQSVSNHELSLVPFEKVLYNFVTELNKLGYIFDKNSPIGQLVNSINAIQQIKFDSYLDKENAFEKLRPIIEDVFGKTPDAQINRRDRGVLEKLSSAMPYLRYDIDDRGAELAAQGIQLFSDGKALFSTEKYKPDGLGRDEENKKSTRSTTKKDSSTTYVNYKNTNKSVSDDKLPYDIDPNSLIGKLQNTVGGSSGELAKQSTLALVLSELQTISKKIPTIGKTGVKSSAQNLLEEFQKMAVGSSMDTNERVAYFDLANGVMSPSLSGTPTLISKRLMDTLSQQYGPDKGYRSRIHTHADSNQTWFSEKDLKYFKDRIGDFGADSIKQEILLTKDSITVFDMTMIETAEKAKQAIDILMKAGSDIDNDVIEKLSDLGARYQSKDFETIGAKGLMDLLGVKNYKNDGKKKGTTADPEVALRGLESYAKTNADNRNSKYIFNSFDGETLKYQLIDTEGYISKVILAWDELENKVRVVSDTSTSSMDKTVKKIQQYRDEISKAKEEKLLSDGDDANFVAVEEEVDNILKRIESEDLSGEKLSSAINELDAAREKLADEGAKLHKLIAKNDKLRDGTAAVKLASKQGIKVRDLFGDLIDSEEKDGIEQFITSDDAPEYLKKYALAYNELIRQQDEYIKTGEINSPIIQNNLEVQAKGVKKIGTETMTAYQNTLRLQELSSTWESQTYTDKSGREHSLGGSKYVGDQNVDRATMLQYAKEVLGANLASVKLNTTTGKLTGVLRKNNYVVADMAIEYDKTTGMMHLFQEKERESLGGMPAFVNALWEKSKAISQYLMSMTSIYRVFGELRKGLEYVREIDSALTELKKVTDETEETYDSFLNTAAKTADKVGSTIKDVVSSTADWARLGYSIQEAAQLAESTQILMNVSEFTDISTATDSLISSIQAFKYTAEESMDVVDILNTIGNNYAISTADLAQSLTKSSGSLVAANGTLEEAVALTATANTIIQDADVVGTALKTVAMRLRGTDTKTMEEEGLDTDGAVTSKSKLQTKIKSLSGVDILTDAGAYKSTYQILSEIANVWKDINDMDQAALLELLAGKRAGSVMSAILENPETLKDAFESASDATGSALKENEKYLDSIQGRIDLFNNAVQTLWSNLLDSSVVKNIVDIGTKLVKFLDTWYGKALAVIVGLDSATTKFGKNLLTKLWSWLDISGYSNKIHKEVISAFTVISKDAITSLSSFDGSALMNFLGGKIEADGINDITKALGAEIMAQKEVTKEVATQILLKQGVKQEDIEGALAAMGYAGANTTLAFSWEAVGVAIKKAGLAFLASPFGKISLIIGGIMLVVHLVDVFTKSTKELAEELDDLRSEFESTQSEIESLNSKLETTRDKIAELQAMPSLSLTDQDELKRLKQQNVELERQLKIQEALAKSTEEKIANRSEEYIGKAWNSNDIDKSYTIDSNGVISEDRWYTEGTNTTDALNTAISKYKQQQQIVDDYKKLIANWDSNKKVQDNFGKFFSYSELRDIDDAKNGLDIAEKRLQDISDGINLVFSDENFTNLEYGMSDEIDGFLDELYAYQLKWQAAQGSYVKSDAISSIFDSTSTEEIQNLGKQLREIADNDTLTDEQKNKQIQDRINNINMTNEAYGRLKTTMETVGVTAADIADYFVLETGAFDSSTIEGITAQYQKGIEIMEQFKATNNDTVTNRMKSLQEGGAVDLFNRPQIDVSKLIEKGWEDAGDGTATVFTNTYSNKDGTVAMNFTPILPDGSVLSPDELTEYAEGVVEGAEDVKGLKIGATFEGEDAIQQACEAAEEIHNLQELYYMGDDVIKIEGVEYDWDELFSENDAGELEARADKFDEILKGMDNETRETFMNLAESVANGQMSWDQAIEKFSLHSMQAVIQNMKTEMENLNKLVFKGLDDEISGIIDTFNEFSAALEDVASSMDLLHTAQTQMNTSGQISVKTALELIASTDQWNQVLAIENGQIKLADGAEQVLIQTKLNAIKSNIELALQEVNTSLAMLDAGDAATTLSDKLGNWLTTAIDKVKEGLAWLDGAAGALWDNLWNGGSNDVVAAGNAAAAKVAKSRADEISNLQRQKANLEAQKAMLERIDTVDEFKNYYDYDTTPGDKYKDDGTSDRLEKLKKKYEHQLSNLENQKTYVQNEIDRLEAEDKGVSKSYYEKQIAIEQQKMNVYKQERAALTNLLNSTKKGTDEWLKYLARCSRNITMYPFELLGSP